MLVDRQGSAAPAPPRCASSTSASSRWRVSCVWLIVRDFNVRAQHVYGKMGFVRFDPEGEDQRRYDSWAEAPAEGSYRMRLPRP